MKKFITIGLLLFLASCWGKKKTNDNQDIVLSCQSLIALSKNAGIDTASLKEALLSAYALAKVVSTKPHDSLTAVVSQLMGRQLILAKQNQNARFYYTNGLFFGTRQLPQNSFIIAQLRSGLGVSYYREENFNVALRHFDSVQLPGTDSATWHLKTENQIKIADCYHRLKNLKAAEYLYQNTISSVNKYFSNREKGDFYTRYSYFLRETKQYQQAIEAAQNNVKILEDLIKGKQGKLKDSVNLGDAYYFIAYAFQDSTAYEASEYYYLKALSVYKAAHHTENYQRGLLNLGLVYRYAKRFDKAKKVLTEGINALKTGQTDFNIVRKGKLFNNRSEVYLDLKQYKEALIDQDSAIYYLTMYDKRASLTTLLMANQKSLLSTYENKAKIYAIYAENGQDTEGYQKALNMTQELIEITDDIRADYFSDNAKLSLANDIKPALEKAIGVCQKLYQKTQDKQYLAQAFSFTEYSRGMVLYENTRLGNHLPPDLKAEGEALKQKEGALIAKNDVEKLQMYLRDKRQYTEKIKAFNHNLMASVGNLQKVLIPNNQTALIEYFVGDSSIFVFSLLQNDLILNELPKTKNFEQQIEALRTEIIEHKVVHDATAFDAQSHALYCYLLKQTLDTLPKNLNQLIIVPDGVLNYLPFDVLVKKSSPVAASLSFKKSKFLLWDYTISYAYSANLLLEQKEMKKDAPELFGGFASKYTDKDTTFANIDDTRATLTRAGAYELKGTKEEVNQISTLLGGKAFLNEFSTEGAFKAAANRYKILHFAMHSLTDDKDASLSRLLFTLTPQDTTNDNDLTAAELQTMHLNAELAVLSACNTGFGTLNKGEGVMSLARAFFYAGVPSTVTSLWEVPDLKTRDIMVFFYENLKKGMNKDEALTTAKRQYLDDTTESGTANPYFWAGFIPIGNMEAIDLSEKRPLSIWGILVGFVALSSLVFWFWKKKRA